MIMCDSESLTIYSDFTMSAISSTERSSFPAASTLLSALSPALDAAIIQSRHSHSFIGYGYARLSVSSNEAPHLVQLSGTSIISQTCSSVHLLGYTHSRLVDRRTLDTAPCRILNDDSFPVDSRCYSRDTVHLRQSRLSSACTTCRPCIVRYRCKCWLCRHSC